MSRAKDELAISFFSFQDIITTITGIMFLIIFMLCITMSQMDEKSQSAQEEVVDLKELEKIEIQALDQAKKSWLEIKDSCMQIDESMSNYLKMSDDELQRKRNELEEKCKELEKVLNSLTTQKADILPQLQKMQQQFLALCAEITLLQKKVIEADATIEQMKNEITTLETELKKKKKTIQITVERTETKQPLLVVCSAKEVTLINAQKEAEHFPITTENADVIARLIQEKISQKGSPLQLYALVMVKPSAFHYFGKLNSILVYTRYELGVEILPDENMEVTF